MVDFSGKSSFVNVTLPSFTSFSPLTPGNFTFVPSGTPVTVTSTCPSSSSCVPTVNVGVALGAFFAGISVVVVAGLCPSSVTVTVALLFVSFGRLLFSTVIVPSVTV